MQTALREHFVYLSSGKLRRKKTGKIVRGSRHHTGYLVFGFGGRQWRYHRACFVWHFGPPASGLVIDHIDGNRENNRIENLRAASPAQNSHNSRKPRSNTSGVKGLRFLKKKKLWRGVIKKNYKMHYVHSANFKTAKAKLEKLREGLHGDFGKS